jgi:hypothetical protein
VPAGTGVAIAHEWLVRYAGSERTVEQMVAEFSDARLLTTLLRASGVPDSLQTAETGVLQRLTGSTLNHEWLIPLMPLTGDCASPRATSTSSSRAVMPVRRECA